MVAFLLILVIGATGLLYSFVLSLNKAQCFINMESVYETDGLGEAEFREQIEEVLVPKMSSNPLRCDELGFREVEFKFENGVAEGTYRLDDRTETYSSSR